MEMTTGGACKYWPGFEQADVFLKSSSGQDNNMSDGPGAKPCKNLWAMIRSLEKRGE